MKRYEDITAKYAAKRRMDLATAKRDGHQLFVAELIRTSDGHILIPRLGDQMANLFAVFAATDELSLVAEFSSYVDAEQLLAQTEAQGWDVMRGRDILPGIRWFAAFKPRAAASMFPWLE